MFEENKFDFDLEIVYIVSFLVCNSVFVWSIR